MSAFKMEGGKQYQQNVGSRRQVFNGTAKKTGYGKSALTKKNLKMNKHGRIVSIKKSRASRKNKHLGKFLRKRGSKTFGPVLAKGGNKMKGGDANMINDFKKALKDAQAKRDIYQPTIGPYLKRITEIKEQYSKTGEEADKDAALRELEDKHNEVKLPSDEATRTLQKYEVFKQKNAGNQECQQLEETNPTSISLTTIQQSEDKCSGWLTVSPGQYSVNTGFFSLKTHYLRKKN